MRMPNSYGSVFKAGTNLRKPWRAVVTTGWELQGDKAVQKRKTIGYYATKAEAIGALTKYNKSPYDDVTFTDCYDKWMSSFGDEMADDRRGKYERAYAQCAALHEMSMRSIKVLDLEACMDAQETYSRRVAIKTLFHQMYSYAMRYEWVDKDYSKLVHGVSAGEKSEKHKAFTEDEIRELWKHTSSDMVCTILVGIYSGWRPAELMTMECHDGVMHGGMKTKAGKNRMVPVHSAIAGLADYERTPVSTYSRRFGKAMEDLGMDHLPHDTRVTFATLCDRYKVDRLAIKMMMGHARNDVTEAVYIRKDIEDLRKEIEKIPKFH